ncbi:MAG: fibronectin type III domain-containing protein [Actinomycetes bacterium]
MGLKNRRAGRIIGHLLVAGGVLLAMTMPMSSAQATPIWTSSQWVRGHVAFDQYLYCAGPLNCMSYVLRQAEVDYTSSAGPTSAPRVGEAFTIHAMTAIVSPPNPDLAGTFRMNLLLPSAFAPAIRTAADFRCVITDISNNAFPASSWCGALTKNGATWQVPAFNLTRSQIAHVFVRVVATRTFSPPANADCSQSAVISTGVCVQMTSTQLAGNVSTLPNPLVSWVPLRVGASLTPTKPGAPRTVVASPRNRAAVVSWKAPASNGGATITKYVVTAAPGGRTCATAGGRSCTVTGLTNRTSYRFTVRATNRLGTGGASTKSSAVVVGTPTTPRTCVVTFPSAGAIRLTWSAPASLGSGAVLRYELRARGHAAGSGVWSAWQPSATTWGSVGRARVYADSGAVAGATYQFQVRAVNGSGLGSAATVTFVQPG